MTNSSPWKITMLLIGQPLISMGHFPCPFPWPSKHTGGSENPSDCSASASVRLDLVTLLHLTIGGSWMRLFWKENPSKTHGFWGVLASILRVPKFTWLTWHILWKKILLVGLGWDKWLASEEDTSVINVRTGLVAHSPSVTEHAALGWWNHQQNHTKSWRKPSHYWWCFSSARDVQPGTSRALGAMPWFSVGLFAAQKQRSERALRGRSPNPKVLFQISSTTPTSWEGGKMDHFLMWEMRNG